MLVPRIEDQLLELANQVAHEYCLSTKWSTWHFWDYYSRLNSLDTAEPSGELHPHKIWNATAPYGSCVDIAIQTTKSLRSRIAERPDLVDHAARVKTLARATSTDPSRMTHCLTALFLEHSCIVVDLSFTFAAFEIELNEHVDSLPAIAMNGDEQRCRLKYCLASNLESSSKGVLLWERLNGLGSTRLFTPLSEYETVEKVSIPMATDTVIVEGFRFPRTKGLKTQAVLEKKPIRLPSVSLGAKHIATVCRVKADFGRHLVTVQVPFEDWLLHEENRDLYELLETKPWYRPVNKAVSNLYFDPSLQRDDFTIADNYSVMRRVLGRLGISAYDFFRVVRSVVEVQPLRLDGHDWADNGTRLDSTTIREPLGFRLPG